MKEKLESFIKENRKICWESEYENDEYCIGENKVRQFFESNQVQAGVMPNEVLAGDFTDRQKTIIARSVLRYLKTSTRIVDKHGKEYPDFIIDIIPDSPGLDYYLSQREA